MDLQESDSVMEVECWLAEAPSDDELRAAIARLERQLRLLRLAVETADLRKAPASGVLAAVLDVMQASPPMAPIEVYERLQLQGVEANLDAVRNAMYYASKERGGSRLVRLARGVYQLTDG